MMDTKLHREGPIRAREAQYVGVRLLALEVDGRADRRQLPSQNRPESESPARPTVLSQESAAEVRRHKRLRIVGRTSPGAAVTRDRQSARRPRVVGLISVNGL